MPVPQQFFFRWLTFSLTWNAICFHLHQISRKYQYKYQIENNSIFYATSNFLADPKGKALEIKGVFARFGHIEWKKGLLSKNMDTFISQTLKVGENKVPLFSWLEAKQMSYGHFQKVFLSKNVGLQGEPSNLSAHKVSYHLGNWRTRQMG